MNRLIFILAFYFLAYTVQAETDNKEQGLLPVDFEHKVTTITADKLVLSNQKRQFTYIDNVKIIQEDMTIICEQLDGTYTEQNEIDFLTARKNVEITKGENIKAYGDKAVYQASSETIELTESPKVEQDGSTLAADRVVIYVKEDRSEAIGNVSVVLKENLSGEAEPETGQVRKKGKKKQGKGNLLGR